MKIIFLICLVIIAAIFTLGRLSPREYVNIEDRLNKALGL